MSSNTYTTTIEDLEAERESSQRADDAESMMRAAKNWIVGDDVGTSSVTIWAVMMGAELPARTSPPLDPSDFGRCYRLLKLIPRWRERLREVAEHVPAWRALVDSWDEVERTYERELATGGRFAPDTYALIKDAVKP
jgi:hypothetical protein